MKKSIIAGIMFINKVRYVLKCKKYADKLDIMGFTLKKAQDEFYKVRGMGKSKDEFVQS